MSYLVTYTSFWLLFWQNTQKHYHMKISLHLGGATNWQHVGKGEVLLWQASALAVLVGWPCVGEHDEQEGIHRPIKQSWFYKGWRKTDGKAWRILHQHSQILWGEFKFWDHENKNNHTKLLSFELSSQIKRMLYRLKGGPCLDGLLAHLVQYCWHWLAEALQASGKVLFPDLPGDVSNWTE